MLEKCNLPEKISRLEECSDRFFVAVYKGLLGDDLPGKSKSIFACIVRSECGQLYEIFELNGSSFQSDWKGFLGFQVNNSGLLKKPTTHKLKYLCLCCQKLASHG